MHEISIAGGIIDIALDYAKKQNAESVKEVWLEVGELTSLNPDQLQFIFQNLTKNTVLEGARFRIDMIKPVIECNQCSYHGGIKFFQALHYVLPVIHCPACDSTDVEILAGRDCTVKNVTFD
ncbi:MAG: hydrogenase maturation nickel metallochaperone HypA [Anaerolineaceae bacterium]|nr:hydrogenase maturation nickel metallochaperone HypA [Anaerolineaceae bacterium]